MAVHPAGGFEALRAGAGVVNGADVGGAAAVVIVGPDLDAHARFGGVDAEIGGDLRVVGQVKFEGVGGLDGEAAAGVFVVQQLPVFPLREGPKFAAVAGEVYLASTLVRSELVGQCGGWHRVFRETADPRPITNVVTSQLPVVIVVGSVKANVGFR